MFSHIRNNENYLSLVFNDTKVQIANSQKHLGLILISKLDFKEHIDNKINKCNKIMGIMKRLSLILSRESLLTIYKSVFRPNLDYADIIYDKPLMNFSIEQLKWLSIKMVPQAFFLPQNYTGTLTILPSYKERI